MSTTTADLEDQVEKALEAVTKAQTNGILEATGAYSYDLTGIVSLIPVVTPLRDKIGRVGSKNGSPFAIWRAFVDVTDSQPRATPGYDKASSLLVTSEQDFQTPYVPVGFSNMVTQDAFDLAQGLYDPYATATMQTLNQTLIAEDRLLAGAQSFALPTPATPTLALVTTGGSIGTGTVHVGVAARTGSNYFYGGNSKAAVASQAVASGTTNSVTASIPAVKGAVAYDWFYSADGATWYFYQTTTVASVTITKTIAADQPVASIALPDVYTGTPTLTTAADNGSAQPDEFNGLLASITGDYNGAGQFVTAGSASTNGAAFVDGGGTALTLTGGTIAQIEELFLAIWNKTKTSPSAIMLSAVQAQEIAHLVLSQPSAVTFLQSNEGDRINVTAGGRVGSIVNTPAGGVTVPLEVHPSVVPGTIIARTDRVPFPNSNITSTLQVRTLRDYAEYDYATSRVAGTVGGGPRKEFEIRSVEALVNFAPVAFGVLSNIS